MKEIKKQSWIPFLILTPLFLVGWYVCYVLLKWVLGLLLPDSWYAWLLDPRNMRYRVEPLIPLSLLVLCNGWMLIVLIKKLLVKDCEKRKK